MIKKELLPQSYNLPKQTIENVAQIAQAQDRSASAVVRIALDRYLATEVQNP